MKNKLIAACITFASLHFAPVNALETEDMVAARQCIFGAEFVDPQSGELPADKVIFSWLSASSFAVSLQGRVFMLDSYLTRLEVERGRTPLVLTDLVNLNPEAILLGHGHNDHADHAAYISAMTDAVIHATEETCGTMRIDFDRISGDPRMQDHPDRAFPENANLDCDPVDHIKPIVFDVNQAAWADPGKQSALNGYCSPTGSAEPTPVSLNQRLRPRLILAFAPSL